MHSGLQKRLTLHGGRNGGGLGDRGGHWGCGDKGGAKKIGRLLCCGQSGQHLGSIWVCLRREEVAKLFKEITAARCQRPQPQL